MSRLPRTAKSNAVWVVLRDCNGFDFEPAAVFTRWAKARPHVEAASGDLAPDAVHAAFASHREAKIYVRAAGAALP